MIHCLVGASYSRRRTTEGPAAAPHACRCRVDLPSHVLGMPEGNLRQAVVLRPLQHVLDGVQLWGVRAGSRSTLTCPPPPKNRWAAGRCTRPPVQHEDDPPREPPRRSQSMPRLRRQRRRCKATHRTAARPTAGPGARPGPVGCSTGRGGPTSRGSGSGQPVPRTGGRSAVARTRSRRSGRSPPRRGRTFYLWPREPPDKSWSRARRAGVWLFHF
jgi:hypothetical protein